MNSKEFDKKLFEIQKEELLSWLHLESDLPYFLESNVRAIFDRLEQLEKENEILKKAIENSNKAYDVLMQNSNIQFLNQNQEITKLKKALDILKEKVDIKLEVYHNGGCTLNHKIISNCVIPNERCLRYLEVEEYKLLKEVLDCD